MRFKLGPGYVISEQKCENDILEDLHEINRWNGACGSGGVEGLCIIMRKELRTFVIFLIAVKRPRHVPYFFDPCFSPRWLAVLSNTAE